MKKRQLVDNTNKPLQRNGPNNSLNPKHKVLPEIPNEKSFFSGDFTNVPPITRSEVRVFLSSTFTDYQVERNALVRHAYPELKTFAAGLGLDFQVVDMRWGVTDDAANEHIVKQLCLREIANCQRLSFGPNFVCLLGDRYGYMPFPSEIEVSEFTKLQEVAQEARLSDTNLLDEWYRRDNNAVPAAYILQPVTSKFPHFGDCSPGREASRKEAMRSWTREEKKLRALLTRAAELAHERGKMNAEGLAQYTRSVTEVEVHAGVLTATFPRNSALCYLRTFTDLAERADLSDSAAWRYTDVNCDGPSPILDQEAQRRRTALKTSKIPQKLPNSNITDFPLKWQPSGIDLCDDDHDQYITSFCQKFVSDVKTLINAQKVHQAKCEKQQGKLLTELREEIFHHLRFCVAKCECFCGREDEIEIVKNYVSKGQKQPFVMYASSGCGKTALSAVLAQKCRTFIGKNSVLLLRFLGTSADSSNLYKLIRSLCQQICQVYGVNFQPKNCNNFSKAVKNFHQLIGFVSQRFAKTRPLVIVLDSLDQLDVGETKTPPTSWLPKVCPPGVYMILSTLPDDKNCWLAALRMNFTDPKGFMELHAIDSPTATLIIDAVLAHKSRTVNKKQYQLILDAIDNYPRPLFLKLLLDQALEWKSYQGMAEEKFPKNVREAILSLFTKLETRYGKLLIAYSLGYLTVGVNGLSEVEIEDVLSCNDKVLNEVYQYHNPPSKEVVRIPSLLWSRIENDVKDYLAERQTDGKTTRFWYHRQFIEAAYDHYVKPREMELNADLAILYSARNGVRKTVRLTRRELVLENCSRGVTVQPLISRNKRMLNSLPHHLLKSGDTDQLLRSAFCNLDFLSTYIDAFSITDLIQLLTETHRITKNQTIETVRDCLRFSEASITSKLELAIQILGQLGNSKKSALEDLCDQCTPVIEQSGKPCLMPCAGCLPSSQSELKAYVSHIKNVICHSQDTNLIAVRIFDRSSKLSSVKILSTELLSTISTCPSIEKDFGSIVQGQFSEDRKWLFILAMHKVLTYSVTTGEKIFQSGININNAGYLNNAMAVSSDKKYLLLASKERFCIGEDVSRVPGVPDYNLGDHKTYKLGDFVSSTMCITFMPGTDIAVSVHMALNEGVDDRFVYVWDCEKKNQKWNQFLDGNLRKTCVVRFGDRVYFGFEDREILYLEPLKSQLSLQQFDVQKEVVPILNMDVNHETNVMAALRKDNSVLVMNCDGLKYSCTVESAPNRLLQLTGSGHCISTTNDGMLQVWRPDENRKKYERKVHQNGVDVLLSLSDNFVITHSLKDESLNLWNFESSLTKVDITSQSRASILDLETNPEIGGLNVLNLSISQDGRWIVTSSDTGPPIIWTLAYDPISFVYVATCETDDVCDFVTFGKQDHYILARKKDSKNMICFIHNPSSRTNGSLNHDFKNSTQCANIGASNSEYGIGACHVLFDSNSNTEVSGQHLVPGINIFTLKQGHRIYHINLLSLKADTIENLSFVNNGRFLTVKFTGVKYHNIRALELVPKMSGSEMKSFIDDSTKQSTDLSRCFNVCPKYPIVLDSKLFKDAKCNTFVEYREGLLLACNGYCPLWNLATDEQIKMETIANSRQWMKHSTSWYFHEKKDEKNSTNVDMSMGKMAVVAITADVKGDVVVTGAEDGSVIVWFREVAVENPTADVIDPKAKRYLKGHTGAITSILLRSNLQTVITASRDRTIRLWDITCDQADAPCLATFTVHAVPEKLYFVNARDSVRIRAPNMNLEPSRIKESYVVALCSDILKNYVVAVRLCHVVCSGSTGQCEDESPKSLAVKERRRSSVSPARSPKI